MFEAKDGKQLWNLVPLSNNQNSQPLQDINRLVVFSQGQILGLEATTGKQIWVVNDDRVNPYPGEVYGNVELLNLVAKNQVSSTAFEAVNMVSGAVLWNLPMILPTYSRPLVDGLNLVVGSGSNVSLYR